MCMQINPSGEFKEFDVIADLFKFHIRKLRKLSQNLQGRIHVIKSLIWFSCQSVDSAEY